VRSSDIKETEKSVHKSFRNLEGTSKIVVASRVRGSKTHNEGPQTCILGAIIKNLVTTAI